MRTQTSIQSIGKCFATTIAKSGPVDVRCEIGKRQKSNGRRQTVEVKRQTSNKKLINSWTEEIQIYS